MGLPKYLVIPAAGLGTRMLPLSSVVPKELLPLGKWPILFYTIQEALQSGIEKIVLVLSQEKRFYFEQAFSPKKHLIQKLKSENKEELLEDLLKLDLKNQLHIVTQQKAAGLGHAIYCAYDIIKDQPFCVALPDEFLISQNQNEAEFKQLISAYHSHQKSCISLMKVPTDAVSAYGIGAIGKTLKTDQLFEITAAIEKPPPQEAPSQYAFIGRYVFGPEIWQLLSKLTPGSGGELQLTDAIHQLAQQGILIGHVFQGKRYDIGNIKGYFECLKEFV